MPDREDNRALLWATAAFAGGLVLHVDRLPLWVTAAALVMIGWRIAAARARVPLPGVIARFVLVGAVVFAVLARFHTLNGLAAGTALLALMAALKLLETYRRRDRLVLVGAGLFLLLAACLDRQSLPRAPLYAGETWLACAALAVVASTGFPGRAALALAGRTLLLALPLAVLLFVFFPRLAGSFWTVPRGEEATTGLSDTMSPGSIGKLTTSYDTAFRATFEGELPPRQQLYWRGPVLHRFDGFTWSRGSGDWHTRQPLEFLGRAYRYRIALEPSQHRWWFALDTPAQSPDAGVALTPDYELRATRPVSDPTSFEALSYTATREAAPLAPWERLENGAGALPRGQNPRSLELARELRAQSASDAAFVSAALGFLRSGGFVYSLEPEELGAEQIDDFLFRTRTGFCGHYASAFTVLMRAGGVPARVVTGYLGGEWNPVGGYLVVRQSDAHAWVEVWLEGRGWTRVDPTAVVAPERLERGAYDLLPDAMSATTRLLRGTPWLVHLLQRWDAANAWWNDRVVKFDYASQIDVLEKLGLRSPDARTLGWAFVLVLLGWLALVGWHLGRSMRPPRPDAIARAYALLCRKLARTGLRREPYEGPLTYAEALRGAYPGMPGAALALLGQYTRLRYGPLESTRASDIEAFRRGVARLSVPRLTESHLARAE
jgi:transglutaminase-like putative cysteine protease